MTAEATALPATRSQPRLYWWKEALLIGVFYAIYSWTRNQFGSAKLSPGELPYEAFDNAMQLIDAEKALGLFHEQALQEQFLGNTLFIQFWNTFYGLAHFVVTIGLFVWMFFKAKPIFARWRNVILATTALGLVGFSLYPVMPPRLLDKPAAEYGGQEIAEARDIPPFGFVDTLAEYGGPWSFDSGTISKLSNQYAAMPSLHCGWALWCTLVGWQLTKRRWARTLLVLHPIATLFCIVVTANHYWIDGIGGVVVLAAGFGIGTAFDHWNNARIERKLSAELQSSS